VTADGSYQLLDENSGEILIKSGSPLSVISGRVYVDTSLRISDLTQVKVGAPDVSWCTTVYDLSNSKILDGTSREIFSFVEYNCYVGINWYGAVGPLWNDARGQTQFGPNDHTCVGDDSAPNTGNADSRHPQLSFIRAYRGYKPLKDPTGQYFMLDSNNNRLYESVGIGAASGSADNYPGQDFLLATINSATDAECQPLLGQGDSAEPDKVWPDVLTGQEDYNPGKFVCLNNTCPSVLPVDTGTAVATQASHVISGSFLVSGVPTAAVQSVYTSDNENCIVAGATYSCTVYDLGGGWSGNLFATPSSGYSLLSSPAAFRALSVDAANADFTLSVSAPRTISGNVVVGTGAKFTGLTSNQGGSCEPTRKANGDPKAGPFTCTYSNLPSGSAVTLTISGDHLCTTSGTLSAPSAVSDPNLTISNITGSIADVTIKIGKNVSPCP
jgi:hypothetical protein